MALELFNYSKSGRGVSKNASKKKPVKLFFEIYIRKFWKLITLNLITFLFCLPIVTIGPAISGMTKVLKNYAIEKNAFTWHDFWKGFKENFVKSLIIGLLDTVFGISFIAAVNVYPQLAENSNLGVLFYALFGISICFFITVIMMNFYTFPMITSTELSLRNIIKNSFILTCVALKRNILTFIISALIVIAVAIGIYYNVLVIILIPCWLITFVGFLIVFNVYPVIQKYVIEPYYEQRGEENPEYDYLKPISGDENVFTDNGGNDVPVDIAGHNSSKTKTIS